VSRRDLPLAERLGALRDAVQAADGSLSGTDVEAARGLLAKAGARVALGDATVVALAGATGSGKSTLFNALAGSELSPPGVRRPTTGTAHACVWRSGEGGDATRLLDWLQVPRRHVQPVPDPALDGLVLLDLPDHDSTTVEHRLEVDRLVQLVDVLVWVLDPQKYADAAVHDRYLRPYAGHAGVLLVALNQADLLDDAARAACLADLRSLLTADGLPDVPVLALSGRTGAGLDVLRAELARRVAARRAASDRLAADVRAVAARLAAECGGDAGDVGRRERRRLGDALAEAAGVPVVEQAVAGSVRARGTARTGWPPLRWGRRLRPDPLRRLHLSGPAQERGRTSLARASGVQEARVASAVRSARDAAGDRLPEGWRDSLRRTVAEHEQELPARLDRAVAGTELGAERTPRWWAAVGGLQWLLLLTALVGGLWLLGLVLLGYLQLDGTVPLPRVQRVPLPTLLLVGGLLAGALLAALCRPLIRLTARRRAAVAGRRLRERVDEVARSELLDPVAAQAASYERFCTAVRRAGAT